MNRLVYHMILAAVVTGVSLLTGCSTARTKFTDPTLRVMIDPASLPAAHHARVQQALHRNGKFIVVDRSAGYLALKEEQNREHKTESDRFLDKEKYALYGKVYGVGSIVVGHVECVTQDGFFRHAFNHCRQYLAIVDARSGEVITTAEGEADSGSYTYNEAPDWTDVVNDLADNFPKNYEPNKDHQILRDYKDLAAEEAQRMRERQPAQETK